MKLEAERSACAWPSGNHPDKEDCDATLFDAMFRLMENNYKILITDDNEFIDCEFLADGGQKSLYSACNRPSGNRQSTKVAQYAFDTNPDVESCFCDLSFDPDAERTVLSDLLQNYDEKEWQGFLPKTAEDKFGSPHQPPPDSVYFQKVRQEISTEAEQISCQEKPSAIDRNNDLEATQKMNQGILQDSNTEAGLSKISQVEQILGFLTEERGGLKLEAEQSGVELSFGVDNYRAESREKSWSPWDQLQGLPNCPLKISNPHSNISEEVSLNVEDHRTESEEKSWSPWGQLREPSNCPLKIENLQSESSTSGSGEGLESTELDQRKRDLGCDYGQQSPETSSSPQMTCISGIDNLRHPSTEADPTSCPNMHSSPKPETGSITTTVKTELDQSPSPSEAGRALLSDFYQALSHSDYCSGSEGVGSPFSEGELGALSPDWLLEDADSVGDSEGAVGALPPMIPGTRRFDDAPPSGAPGARFRLQYNRILEAASGLYPVTDGRAAPEHEFQEFLPSEEPFINIPDSEMPPHVDHSCTSRLNAEEKHGAEGEAEADAEVLECKWAWCGAECVGQEALVRHIESYHVEPRKGEQFTCLWESCMRQARPFNARYKLLIHMRVHSGEKPNKCPFIGCPKAFSRLENLKIHQRSHTGERPYKCQYEGCLKAFSNSSDRAKHQRTHLDTKPYACQISGCTKKYTDPSSLRKHIKNHSSPHASVKMRKSTNSGSQSSSKKSAARRNNQSGKAIGKFGVAKSETVVDDLESTSEFVPYDYSPIYFSDFDQKFSQVEDESLTKNFIPFLTQEDALFMN